MHSFRSHGGGGNAHWAAFEVALRDQISAWLAYDDARRDGADASVIGTALDALIDARSTASAARARLGHA